MLGACLFLLSSLSSTVEAEIEIATKACADSDAKAEAIPNQRMIDIGHIDLVGMDLPEQCYAVF